MRPALVRVRGRRRVRSSVRDGFEDSAGELYLNWNQGMKTMLSNVRHLAMAAALLGVLVSSQAVSAQSELDASEAEAFFGEWIVSLSTDFFDAEMDLKIEDQGGKVAASIAFPEQPASDVTDITRSGEALVLSYEIDSPQGLFPVSVTLTPNGEGLTAAFDFGGQFQAEGSAERVGG